MSIDKFFLKKYDKNKYNCAHFVSEVWLEETGEDISERLAGVLKPRAERTAKVIRNFKKLQYPESPCIVLFQRKGMAPHVGIYLRGRVLHIKEEGVEFQPLEVVALLFNKIGFYK